MKKLPALLSGSHVQLKTDLKERLQNIMERKTWKRAAGAFVAILLFTASAFSFLAAPVSAEQNLSPAAVDASTENLAGYSAALLKQKLTDLEKKYRTEHKMAGAFMDRAEGFDGDAYWTPFIQALEKVGTRDDYLAFLNTRFPGINEALPGDPSITRVMPRLDGMIRSVVGIDLAMPRYEAFRNPGSFTIRGSDMNNNYNYEVETRLSNITYFAVDYVYPDEMQHPNAAPASEAEKDGRLKLALDMAKDFARHYLAGRDEDCDVNYEREGGEEAPVTNPARFNVSFPATGWQYKVDVNLTRMRVMRAEPIKMGETILSAQDYNQASLPLNTINYDDLLLNIDDRVKVGQLYICQGTIAAMIQSDPQLAVMKLSGGTQPAYVALLNGTGDNWKVKKAYRFCSEPTSKYEALPKFASSGNKSEYWPLMTARYTIKTENYSAKQLTGRLARLLSKYGGSSGVLDVFKNHAKEIDLSDPYMMDFAITVMSADSQASYHALLCSYFPGINEALPGYTPIDQLRKKYKAMLSQGMEADLVKCYWRYEACLGPGEFEIILGEGSRKKRYRIHYMNDAVTDVTTYLSQVELKKQIIVPIKQQTADDLNKIETAARDFAVSYLYAGDMECKMSFPDKALPKGKYPGRKPVNVHMAIPGTGLGYIITVDLETMLVTQVTMSKMEVSDNKD